MRDHEGYNPAQMPGRETQHAVARSGPTMATSVIDVSLGFAARIAGDAAGSVSLSGSTSSRPTSGTSGSSSSTRPWRRRPPAPTRH